MSIECGFRPAIFKMWRARHAIRTRISSIKATGENRTLPDNDSRAEKRRWRRYAREPCMKPQKIREINPARAHVDPSPNFIKSIKSTFRKRTQLMSLRGLKMVNNWKSSNSYNHRRHYAEDKCTHSGVRYFIIIQLATKHYTSPEILTSTSLMDLTTVSTVQNDFVLYVHAP